MNNLRNSTTSSVLAMRPRRHGVTALLAMLYLALFSTLAIGFYVSTTTAVQVAANDDHIARAFFAAESGMNFMRYHLSRVSIPPSMTGTIIDELTADLQGRLDETTNFTDHPVEKSGSNTIGIPGDGSYVTLDDQTSFRATITEWAGDIVVKVDGRYANGDIARTITMDFTRRQNTTSSVFNYAVASKGQINMNKGEVTTVSGVDPLLAQMMSAMDADPAIKVSGGVIGGELFLLDDAGISITGGEVAGNSSSAAILAHAVNYLPEPPEFPEFDPTVYRQYATNNWVDGKKTQANIIIPANSGTPGSPVKFNANDTVQGILYIESPNCVKFNGNFKLQGFIVMEKATSSTTDHLEFSGNVTMSPVPNASQFDPLRATSGVAIMAPTAKASFTGSSDSFVKGSVIVDQFSFAGSADMQIDQGTLMTLYEYNDSAVFNGKKVRFTATGANNLPSEGVTYSSYFVPNPASYQEVSE